jgi:hypothetical protein
MKYLTILAVLFLASCAKDSPASWENTPNPLDTPSGEYKPYGSHGAFGPNWEARRAFGG